MSKPAIALIVAIAENNAIGKNNQLLWHLPKDFQFFKQHTQNKTVVMGKNTWLSLPIKPLPKRKNIILSQSLSIEKTQYVECYQQLTDIPWDQKQENMIIGGASLYEYFLPLCNRLYLTHVQAKVDADTFFPTIDFSQWRQSYVKHHRADEHHAYAFDCAIYERLHF